MRSTGLFHKAISQSGVAANPWTFSEWANKATNKGFQLAEYLGRATSDPKVAFEFLKTIDAKKLREAEQKLLTKTVSILTFYCDLKVARIRYLD